MLRKPFSSLRPEEWSSLTNCYLTGSFPSGFKILNVFSSLSLSTFVHMYIYMCLCTNKQIHVHALWKLYLGSFGFVICLFTYAHNNNIVVITIRTWGWLAKRLVWLVGRDLEGIRRQRRPLLLHLGVRVPEDKTACTRALYLESMGSSEYTYA